MILEYSLPLLAPHHSHSSEVVTTIVKHELMWCHAIARISELSRQISSIQLSPLLYSLILADQRALREGKDQRVQGKTTGDSNYIDLPVALYGPKGSGKSSVIGTWTVASTDSTYTFLSKSHAAYKKRIELDGQRSMPEETIINGFLFNSSKGGEGHEVGTAALKEPSDCDAGRIVMRETPPVEQLEDLRDDGVWPTGLLVLVLDASEVLEELTAFEKAEEAKAHAEEAGRVADAALAKASAAGASSQVKRDAKNKEKDASVAAEEARQSRKDAEDIKKKHGWDRLIGDTLKGTRAEPLGVYPPAACILAKSNLVDESKVDALLGWVQDQYGIRHVTPCPTFPLMDDEERKALLNADPGSNLRKDFKQIWNPTVLDSLKALTFLFDMFFSDESAMVKKELRVGNNQTWGELFQSLTPWG